MTFKGFDLKYPEYEVITPHTALSFHFRTLNVSEEERLKGSLMTPQKTADHLNKCIFEACVKLPSSVKDYGDFIKAVTLKDRDALLYGLYHISYGEIRDYDVRCTSCGKEYPVTVQASDTFNMNSYPDKDVLSKVEKLELPVSKGVFAYIRQPTLADEDIASKSLSHRPNATQDLIAETLIISKFEQDNPKSKTPTVYDERIDILDAYLSLPTKDRRAIYNKYMEIFGKYGVELKMQTSCTACGESELIDIDLVTAFFRVLYSL